MRTGIVAVHGVIPQARYGFQDQVAAQLQAALNRFPNSGGPWNTSVVFPTGSQAAATPSCDPTNTPTISRVYRTTDDPNAPSQDFFDVHEAYWSPIDKGKTTGLRVLRWLLTTVFLPINDTARYSEHVWKIVWDVGYLLVALVLGAGAFVGCVLGIGWALGATQLDTAAARNFGDALRAAGDPGKIISGLDPQIITALIIGVIGAYLAAQFIRACWSLAHNVETLLARDTRQLWSRIMAISILALLAAAGIVYCMNTPPNGPLQFAGIALVVTVLLFQSGRALLLWFLANFFGDVQIYTTRDENSDFFALREQILDLVTRTIVNVATTDPSGKPYDRVYVLAHSLGSTIAMDALLRIYNAQRAKIVSPEAWGRIRGFVTFGTALEKTKYFFNAWSPTKSQAYQEWQNDLYGPLFTADPSALVPDTQTHGIYWLNCWYFSDFVSDQISSYRSYVLPGALPSTRHANRAAAAAAAQNKREAVAGRLIADNRWRFGDFAPWRLHFVTHGDYLGDQTWFWDAVPRTPKETGVIDVVTSGFEWATPHPQLKALSMQPELPSPFEEKAIKKRGAFLTADIFTPTSSRNRDGSSGEESTDE